MKRETSEKERKDAKTLGRKGKNNKNLGNFALK